MYRVLIVEDEILVRLGLKNSIEWTKYNMTVIADVSNGQAAWEVFEKASPDIVITDLKMPIMGGMELISRIRERNSKTKIIILSCLEEFELVRKALSLSVSDYILKLSMTPDEIETVLKKAYNELEKQNMLMMPASSTNLDSDTLKENILKDYLFYNVYSENDFNAHVERLNLRLKPDCLLMCLIEIDDFEILKDAFKDSWGQIIKFSLPSIINDILTRNKRGEIFHCEEKRFIMLFSFYDLMCEKSIKEKLYDILEHIRKAMKTYYNLSVSFGVGSIQNGYYQLKQMYQECVKALEYKFFLGKGLNLTLDELKQKSTGLENISKVKKLEGVMGVFGEMCYKELNESFEQFANTSCITKTQIQGVFYLWLHWPISALHLTGKEINSLVLIYSERIRHCETIDEVIEEYRKYVMEITEIRKKRKLLSREVTEAIHYIQKHYGQDISLSLVADHVKMSPNYLGTLFKTELQQSFAEYLTELRIKAAKEMLLSTLMKSYEIADRIGFTDVSYFSRTFKRVTGIRPNEFRKQWISDWTENLDHDI